MAEDYSDYSPGQIAEQLRLTAGQMTETCSPEPGLEFEAAAANCIETLVSNLETARRERDEARLQFRGLLDLQGVALKGQADGMLKLAQEAAKWRALRNCARISAIGAAGMGNDAPYCHVALSFWTIHDAPSESLALSWLDRFVDKALRVEKAKDAPA